MVAPHTYLVERRAGGLFIGVLKQATLQNHSYSDTFSPCAVV